MDNVRIVLMQRSSIERALGDALPFSSAPMLMNAFRVVAIPWRGLVGKLLRSSRRDISVSFDLNRYAPPPA
jgi:hypothetical protein